MSIVRKIVIGLGLTLILGAVVSFALIQSHAHRIWGGYVERIGATEFRVVPEPTAITNVAVLSADGTSMAGPRTVVFDRQGIVVVLDGQPPPDGVRTIDGSGKFLIPGLIDAHVHLRRQPNDLLLYLANGITHIRDLSGSPALLKLRDEVEAGRAGPRIDVASPLLFTTGRLQGWFRESTEPRWNVRTPEQADAAVRALAADGYDLLKLYSDIDPEVFRAVNRAADEIGIHTVGHLPFGFPVQDLASLELDELGHIEEIVKVLQNEFDADVHGPYHEAFPGFVASRAEAVVEDLLDRDVTVNTTLWLMEVVGRQAFDLPAQLAQLPLEYANPAMVEGSPYLASVGWLPGRNAFEVRDDPGPEERARIEAAWEARAEAHRILFCVMVERGVRLTAGTDATTHLMIPGFSLHRELESMVRNGMSPAQALRAATAVPAELMSSNAGRIEPGRAADLLLLSANPLESIANAAAIEAVVVQGRVYERSTLEEMLDRVREVNDASRNFDLEAFRPASSPEPSGSPNP